MKTKQLLLLILSVVYLSCSNEDFYEPVSRDCDLPFQDSSQLNPDHGKYQALLDKYVSKGIPGLVLLIRTPEGGLWVGSSGYARIEDKTPMLPCHIVYSASVGKTYCAAATMLMQEEGLFQLDEKIMNYLPEHIINNIPNGRTATIRHLISNTSGIPNSDHRPEFVADVLNNPFRIKTEDLVKYVYGKDAEFNAGEDFGYSSTGYELLAMVLDKASGEHHSKYYTSHIFEPLNLRNTYYKNEPDFPKPAGLINSYFDRLGDGKLENVSDINNYLTQVFTGSDGTMGTVYDHAVFFDALLKGNLVSPESLAQMQDWTVTGGRFEGKYGYGLLRREGKYGPQIGHTGRAMGSGIDVFYFPDHDVTIVSATNLGTFLDTDLALLYDTDFHLELLDAVFE